MLVGFLILCDQESLHFLIEFVYLDLEVELMQGSCGFLRIFLVFGAFERFGMVGFCCLMVFWCKVGSFFCLKPILI